MVDHEMLAIVAGPLGVIANRRNTLTRTCRIPHEILGQIFLHYQRSPLGFCISGHENGSPLALHGTVLWWVPGVAHVCRHWRTVAFQIPQLWSNIALHLGRTWALRMLSLSRAVPINIGMNDPRPCGASTGPLIWGRLPKPGPPMLNPLEVLAKHLFHTRELELGSCSCTAPSWVSLLETTAPLLETFWLHINLHQSGSLPNIPIALPDNFLATHPRLRRLVLENAFLSSWSPGPHPLSQLVVLIVTAPAPGIATSTTPTHDQLLDCLLLMPALEELNLANCLPPFTLTSKSSPRTVSLPCLRALTLHDLVDRCNQALRSFYIPLRASEMVTFCYTYALPNLDFLRILPLLSARLSRTSAAIPTSKGGMGNQGCSRALTLSLSYNDGRTHFSLSVWRQFTPLTATEARAQYSGPKSTPDVQLKCEWGSGNPEMERRALLQACAGVPRADLRALSVRAETSLWSVHDWYDTFVGSSGVTDVLAFGASGENLLLALELYTGSGGPYSTPLFPELTSLTLVGVDFVRMGGTAWRTLTGMLFRREASRACVTILDRIELRKCAVKKEMVDFLKGSAVVVVWDTVTDPNK